MNRAQDILKKIYPDESKLEGQVKLPVDFDSARAKFSTTLPSETREAIDTICKNSAVVPQYGGMKRKIGGIISGFFVNPVVRAQNINNLKLQIVCEEYEKLFNEKVKLLAELNTCKSELENLRGENR